VLTLPILAISGVAGYYDVRWRRVPNWLTAGLAVLALAGHGLTAGLPGLGASAAGLAIALCVLFPLFALRALGAGDVKFVAALGGALTYALVPRLLLFTFLAAGAIAAADVIRRRRVLRTAATLLHAHRGLPGIDTPGALLVPFSLAGAIAAWWLLLGARG
jgi:prepilin peptidase CpaA